MQDLLRDIEDHDLGPAIAHFLNCFFGSCQNVGGKVAANSMQSRTQKKVCDLYSSFSSFLHIPFRAMLLYAFEALWLILFIVTF